MLFYTFDVRNIARKREIISEIFSYSTHPFGVELAWVLLVFSGCSNIKSDLMLSMTRSSAFWWKSSQQAFKSFDDSAELFSPNISADILTQCLDHFQSGFICPSGLLSNLEIIIREMENKLCFTFYIWILW